MDADENKHKHMITLQETKRLYIRAGGPTDHGVSEWSEIMVEMDAVIEAKSDLEAAKVIEWWGNWGRFRTPIAFAKFVRKAHKSKV